MGSTPSLRSDPMFKMALDLTLRSTAASG